MRKVIKFIRQVLPFKRQLFFLLKKVYSPPERIYRHLYFKGKLHLNIGNAKFKMMHYGFQLENDLFWKGVGNGWEKNSIHLWVELCKNSTIILDIGANTGIYSLIASTISPQATVYAFEPVSRVFKRLDYNNRLNSFSINCIEKAVSDYTGEAVIFDTDAEHIYSVTVNRNLNHPDLPVKEVPIETITLDDFVELHNIKNIDLIKIDVEKHEPLVLSGFKKNLSIMRPSIIIEILDDEIAYEVEKQLMNLNYIFYNIDEISGLTKVSHIKKSSSHNYFACQPAVADKLKI